MGLSRPPIIDFLKLSLKILLIGWTLMSILTGSRLVISSRLTSLRYQWAFLRLSQLVLFVLGVDVWIPLWRSGCAYNYRSARHHHDLLLLYSVKLRLTSWLIHWSCELIINVTFAELLKQCFILILWFNPVWCLGTTF